jgi:hypothetical protein
MTTSTTTPSIRGFSELNEEEQARIGMQFPIAWDNPKAVQRDNVAIFIVPNGLVPVRELRSGSELAQETLARIESFFGLQIADDDWLVQFWATDRSDRSGNSNLNDHGYVDEHGDLHRFPTYIPVSLVRDKNEGAILRIYGDQGTFTLQCLQRPYRYARFGRFEETLKGLLDRVKK